MAHWAIGDIQGCDSGLGKLLKKIHFRSDRDQLWLVGDLVNRGGESLEVIRRIRSLGDGVQWVLGNHDLALLAWLSGCGWPSKVGKEIEKIGAAKERTAITDWLRSQSLIVHDEHLDCAMVHAGLHPAWDIHLAKQRAAEVEAVLHSEHWRAFMGVMRGNTPARWQDSLQGDERLRTIVNIMTRMRFIGPNDELDFQHNGPPGSQPAPLQPWFERRRAPWGVQRLYVGHWSALGVLNRPPLLALDSGYVWNGALTAACLDDPERGLVQLRA
jgi:bis(5'-nucleosyl)-tetraphosphatase (symmetrical)